MTNLSPGRRRTLPLCLIAALLPGFIFLARPEPARAQIDSTFAARSKAILAFQDQSNFAAADSLSRLCLEEARKRFGRESLEAAEFMIQIAITASRAGKDKDPSILDFASHGLSIRQAKLPADDVQIAVGLRTKAFVLQHNRGSAAAIPLLEQAVAIRKKVNGVESKDYASALVDLALPSRDVDRSRFRSLNEEAAAILARVAPDDRLRGAVLTNLGVSAMDAGDYAAALRYSEDAVRVKLKAYGPEHPRVLVSIANVGAVKRVLGDYVGALELLEQVERSQLKALGPYHSELMVTLENMGSLRASMGDFEDARKDFERMLAVVDSSMARVSLHSVESRLAIGEVLINLNEPDRARSQIAEADSLDVLLEGPEGAQRASASVLLARLELESGDAPAAIALFERALKIRKKELQPDDVELANTRILLAEALFETGETGRSRSLFDEAAASLERAGLENTTTRVRCLAGQCAIRLASNDSRPALDVGLQAEAVSRVQLRLAAQALPERVALRFAASRPSTLGLLVFLAARAGKGDPDLVRKVWDSMIQSRAIVLDEMAERTHALALAEDPETQAQKDSLNAARSRLANLMLRGPADSRPEHYSALVSATRTEAEGLESAVAARSRRFREARDRRSFGFSQIDSALGPNDALIAFAGYRFRDEDGYASFILTPGRDPEVIDLGTKAGVEAAVSAWYAEASRDPSGIPNAEASYEAAARALYQVIWAPLSASLSSANRIFIVPDGTLKEVSFAALLGPEGFLVEQGPGIQYLSAERDLAAPAPEIEGHGFLAMGGIDYSEADKSPDHGEVQTPAAVRPTLFRGRLSNCTAVRDMQFRPLPGSKKELKDVVHLWRGSGRRASDVRIVTGRAATESTLKTAAKGEGILHLATHAFLEGECSKAGTRGVGGLETAASRPDPETDNPLRLSGLAFAGANRRNSVKSGEDDGILTAEEVTSLDLTGLGWAVLSACDTGRGSVIPGEGLLGLRRAFQVAGARTLITSLWPVGDESTREWMNGLYESRLKSHETTIASVRSAELRILNRRRARHLSVHPFYWAGFIASGDWR